MERRFLSVDLRSLLRTPQTLKASLGKLVNPGPKLGEGVTLVSDIDPETQARISSFLENVPVIIVDTLSLPPTHYDQRRFLSEMFGKSTTGTVYFGGPTRGNIVTKIDLLDKKRIRIQYEAVRDAYGLNGALELVAVVKNEKGEVIGFQSQEIENCTSIETFARNGGRISPEKAVEIIRDYIQIQKRTGLPHSDTTTGSNFQISNDGSRVWFTDWGGYQYKDTDKFNGPVLEDDFTAFIHNRLFTTGGNRVVKISKRNETKLLRRIFREVRNDPFYKDEETAA